MDLVDVCELTFEMIADEISEQLRRRKEKEELERAVDLQVLKLVEYRSTYSQAIADCVAVKADYVERSVASGELILPSSYRPPKIDFDAVVARIEKSCKEKILEEQYKRRIQEKRFKQVKFSHDTIMG
ncbi:unnamed protein product [Anisakis simplex]|uniref:Late competence development protein ComFB n=1 Tax=Anisakis simplex TaxID=6269 RepID=A0A0M3K418_ANISI|nr:unnamed protein product [Anisakis simplex]